MALPACWHCGTTEWAAKNDDFCTSCEREWYLQLGRVFRFSSEGPNPTQVFVDEVLMSVLEAGG